jgi:hypothetical protein
MVEILMNMNMEYFLDVKEKLHIMEYLLELVIIIGKYKIHGEINGEKMDILGLEEGIAVECV